MFSFKFWNLSEIMIIRSGLMIIISMQKCDFLYFYYRTGCFVKLGLFSWKLGLLSRWVFCHWVFCHSGSFVPVGLLSLGLLSLGLLSLGLLSIGSFVPVGLLSIGSFVNWVFCLWVFCTHSLLPMNQNMTTAYSNEIDSQNLKIRNPDPFFFKTGIRIRSETDRIRNTVINIINVHDS